MLGIDRRTLQQAWTVFLFALLLFVIYEVRRALFIFAVALIFAFLLAPIVNSVERSFHARVPRVVSLGIVYVVLTGLIVIAAIPLVSRISDEAAALAGRFPDAIKGDPLANLPIPRWLESWRPQITQYLHDRLSDLGDAAGPILSAAGTHIISGITALLPVILIPILGFFFLKDGNVIRGAIVESFDRSRQPLINSIFLDLHLLLAQYIRALVILSLATFTFYSIFLATMSAPFPVLFGGLAAVLEFIPVVGPLTAAIAIMVVAAATGYPHLLILFLFLGFYRIFQDYVLNPYLMSSGIELHPLLVLFGVLAGEQLAGIPGMFFSVPTMAALRLIVIRLRRRRVDPQ